MPTNRDALIYAAKLAKKPLSLVKGPDIINSMDPAELKFLIDRSKEIHTALMNPKVRTAPEEDVYRFARGSIVADRDLAAGHVITERDIWARRPGSGEISVLDAHGREPPDEFRELAVQAAARGAGHQRHSRAERDHARRSNPLASQPTIRTCGPLMLTR